jgi:hypothetical protein
MKYLLCRPCGGLNDNFFVIQSCIEYSKKYNRILLIDTNYNNIYKFNFCDVFKIIDDKNIIYDSNKIKEIIINKELTIFPNEIKDLYDYSAIWKKNGYCLEDTNIKTQIHYKIDYIENIILHNNCGSGHIPHKLIKNLKLIEYYINDIIKKYNQIPKPYLSIHIRNTDIKCDYKSIYEKNKEQINKSNIFLATDSIEAFNYFKSLNLKIFSFTKLPDECKNYHYCNMDKKEILLNTISDLLLLGLGNDFIYSEENKGGYYKLAYFLYQNKDILHNILDKKLIKPKIPLFKKR